LHTWPCPWGGAYHAMPRGSSRSILLGHMAQRLFQKRCAPPGEPHQRKLQPVRSHKPVDRSPGKCAGATPSIQVPAERILRGALGTAPAGPGCSNPLAVQPRAQHNWIVSQSGPSQTCVSTLVDDLAVFCLTARFDSPQLLFQKKQALL